MKLWKVAISLAAVGALAATLIFVIWGDFRPPTATEVFNLRSKCAELGQKMLEDNVRHGAPFISQVSHYDPRTNRCYVELTGFGGTGAEANYDRELFDGQTKQKLAQAVKGKDGRSGGMVFDKQYNRGIENDGWDYTNSYIDQMMAEDRK